jgi:hypothetical protein
MTEKGTINLIFLLILFMGIIITGAFLIPSPKTHGIAPILNAGTKVAEPPIKVLSVQISHIFLRQRYDIPPMFTDQEIDTVLSLSDRLNIPQHICFNLICRESGFDSAVQTDPGFYGYLQLSHKYFTARNRFENLRQGFRHLKNLFIRLGSWQEAVIFFNSGNCHCSKKKYVEYILNHGI